MYQINIRNKVGLKGRWIAPAGVSSKKNVYFYARKKVFINKPLKEDLLYIAAESYYNLYINGLYIGKGPARGTGDLVFFDAYDISSLLHLGENHIAVLINCMNIPTMSADPSESGFILETTSGVCSDSSWDVLVSDEWQTKVPYFTAQIGFMECRNFIKEPLGWEQFKDNSKWQKAAGIGRNKKIYKKKLLARDVPPLKSTKIYAVDITKIATVSKIDTDDLSGLNNIIRTEEHKEIRDFNISASLQNGQVNEAIIRQIDNKDISILVDFGKEVTGAFMLKLNTEEELIADITYMETEDDNHLRNKSPEKVSCGFTDRYILRKGNNLITNSLHGRGFKFVQIIFRNMNKPVTLHEIYAVDERYPFLEQGRFGSNDKLLNLIDKACKETLSVCTTDTFTDCPWRERAFWVNDFIVHNVIALQAFGDSRVSKRCIRLALSHVNEENLIPGVCPDAANERLYLIPTSLYFPVIVKDFLMYTNDTDFVAEIINKVENVISSFSSWEDKNGLISAKEKYWCFLDWSYDRNALDNKCSAPINWLYVLGMRSLAFLLNETGNPKQARKYEHKAKNLVKSIDDAFWIPEEKRYTEWFTNGKPDKLSSQLVCAIALQSDIYDPQKKQYLIDGLDRKDFLMPELFMHFFIFRAMRDNNMHEIALERIKKYWGDIVSIGSSTIWEGGIHRKGKPLFNGLGSMAHAFSTSPVEFFQTAILGCVPLEPGFKRFLINPHPLGLTKANGIIPTPQGNIIIEWKLVNDGIKIKLKMPANTEALVENRIFKEGVHTLLQRCEKN